MNLNLLPSLNKNNTQKNLDYSINYKGKTISIKKDLIDSYQKAVSYKYISPKNNTFDSNLKYNFSSLNEIYLNKNNSIKFNDNDADEDNIEFSKSTNNFNTQYTFSSKNLNNNRSSNNIISNNNKDYANRSEYPIGPIVFPRMISLLQPDLQRSPLCLLLPA